MLDVTLKKKKKIQTHPDIFGFSNHFSNFSKT